MAILIEFFDVPPDADQAFLADWRAAGAGVLFRAFGDTARFRYVAVARDADAGQYAVVHEDGDVDGAGGVTVIEPFEVAPGDEERFVADWHRLRTLFAGRRGYLGSRLHRARTAADDFPYVAVGRWSSPLMRHRALQRPDVRTAAEPLRSSPNLYERVARP